VQEEISPHTVIFVLKLTPELLVVGLSTRAGAVEVIGFLALMGLFKAHITGNQRWVTARAPPAT
jgi:hypothetical protein